MRTIPEQKPGHVLVELVWPESRGEKTDCKNYTDVVWSNRGDVKNYPAHLWPRLREHPDVWRLYTPAEPAAAPAPAQPVAKTEPSVDGQEDELLERQQEAAGRNTDLVAVMVGFEDDGDVAADTPVRATEPPRSATVQEQQAETVVAHAVRKDGPVLLTLADLQAMSVQAVRELAQQRDYMLHPRMKAEKLYEQFLNMQALRAASADGAKA